MVIRAICWGALILILLSITMLIVYLFGMTMYFHYQLKDGKGKREYTEEQRKKDEEQLQAIREMRERKEEKRQRKQQRKSETNRR